MGFNYLETCVHLRHMELTTALFQMSNQVSDLTARVQDLHSAKVSLEMKVNTLEAEMNCIMGRAGGCDPSKCLNGGIYIEVGHNTIYMGITWANRGRRTTTSWQTIQCSI